MNNKNAIARVSLAVVLLIMVFTGLVVKAAPVNMPLGHWAEVYLMEALVGGYLRGYADGSLRPDNSVTRAEFAAMVVRAFDSEDNAAALSRMLSRFADMDAGHWANGYLEVCADLGVILGDDRGYANPDSLITRQDAAVMVERLLRGYGVPLSGSYTIEFLDEDLISGYAVKAVADLVSAGLLVGDENGMFRPLADLTRAEAVTMILRALDLIGKRWSFQGKIAGLPSSGGVEIEVQGQRFLLHSPGGSFYAYKNGELATRDQLSLGDNVKVAIGKEEGSSILMIIE